VYQDAVLDGPAVRHPTAPFPLTSRSQLPGAGHFQDVLAPVLRDDEVDIPLEPSGGRVGPPLRGGNDGDTQGFQVPRDGDSLGRIAPQTIPGVDVQGVEAQRFGCISDSPTTGALVERDST
jgi:hypothetical protein